MKKLLLPEFHFQGVTPKGKRAAREIVVSPSMQNGSQGAGHLVSIKIWSVENKWLLQAFLSARSENKLGPKILARPIRNQAMDWLE